MLAIVDPLIAANIVPLAADSTPKPARDAAKPHIQNVERLISHTGMEQKLAHEYKKRNRGESKSGQRTENLKRHLGKALRSHKDEHPDNIHQQKSKRDRNSPHEDNDDTGQKQAKYRPPFHRINPFPDSFYQPLFGSI